MQAALAELSIFGAMPAALRPSGLPSGLRATWCIIRPSPQGGWCLSPGGLASFNPELVPKAQAAGRPALARSLAAAAPPAAQLAAGSSFGEMKSNAARALASLWLLKNSSIPMAAIAVLQSLSFFRGPQPNAEAAHALARLPKISSFLLCDFGKRERRWFSRLV